jgi:Na+-transporting NADH:ubiquinone oxidoreductase subunit NqrE
LPFSLPISPQNNLTKYYMKDKDYTFGTCTVYCDGKGCNEDETIEGFDGHCPQYSDVNDEIRGLGWTVKKENGEWLDLCPDCSSK